MLAPRAKTKNTLILLYTNTYTKNNSTHQLLSSNNAAQRSPFRAVYDPGRGG